MGILKNLINKVLDTEVPPVIEKFVKKGLAKRGAVDVNLSDTSPCSVKEEDRGEPVSINHQIPKITDDLWSKIPDDVKEVIFYTGETPQMENHTGLNTITFSFDGKNFKNNYSDHVKNDPSTIYFQLPVKIPQDISAVSKLPYMPSYIGITPEQRYIYLTWLQDISKDIDVGYKFIFYYGLERMLLIGNYKKAFDMIVRLRKNTDNNSFLSYSGNALFYTAIKIGRKMLEKLRLFFEDEIWRDKQIFLKLFNHESIGPHEISRILKGLNVNKRYLDEEIYIEQLGKLFSERYGRSYLFPQEIIDETISVIMDIPVFANFSLPYNIRIASKITLPELNNFYSTIIDLHKICHERTKGELAKIRKKNTASPQDQSYDTDKVAHTERNTASDSEEAQKIRETDEQRSNTKVHRHNTILCDMIPQIKKSPYFKSEKKQILIDILKKTPKLHDPFSYADCLTATEKKALGFNARLKISRQMIDFLNDDGLKFKNPKEIISTIYYTVYSKYEAEWEAEDAKERHERFKKLALEDQKQKQDMGLKLYVWETSGDERVCEACKVMHGKLCRWDDAALCSDDDGKTWKHRPKGAILMHPGHHEGRPGYYENCRCIALSYYPELMGDWENF